MRSTRLLFSAAVLALGAAACSSSSSGGSPPVTPVGDGGGDASNVQPGDDGGSQTNPGHDGGSGVSEAGTDGAPGDGGDGGLPPPDLSMVCPDSNPQNTSSATAQALTVDSSGEARVGVGVVQNSDDWFSFTAAKSDPAYVQAAYTVGSGNTSQLYLEVDNSTGGDQGDDDTTRSLPSQTLSVEWETQAGGVYYPYVSSNSAVCTAVDFDLQTQVCTDSYEDNDTSATAAPLTFTTTGYTAPTTWATATTSVDATVDGLDDDWYTITAPKADPMSVSVSYTRPASDPVQLYLEADNTTGGDVGDDDTTRSGNSQTLNVVWQAAAAGATYNILVSSNTQADCADYTAAFNGLWCTDEYEDNDTSATASALPPSGATATVTKNDDDYYTIPSPATNGSCTVSYTVPSGSQQQLYLEVDDSTGGDIGDDDTSRNGTSQTLTVTWTSPSATPAVVYVSANTLECTTYTISCQ